MEKIIIILSIFLFANIFWHSVILKKSTFYNESTKHALIAFVTAYSAHLDLIYSAFMMAWLITYISDNNEVVKKS